MALTPGAGYQPVQTDGLRFRYQTRVRAPPAETAKWSYERSVSPVAVVNLDVRHPPRHLALSRGHPLAMLVRAGEPKPHNGPAEAANPDGTKEILLPDRQHPPERGPPHPPESPPSRRQPSPRDGHHRQQMTTGSPSSVAISRHMALRTSGTPTGQHHASRQLQLRVTWVIRGSKRRRSPAAPASAPREVACRPSAACVAKKEGDWMRWLVTTEGRAARRGWRCRWRRR